MIDFKKFLEEYKPKRAIFEKNLMQISEILRKFWENLKFLEISYKNYWQIQYIEYNLQV